MNFKLNLMWRILTFQKRIYQQFMFNFNNKIITQEASHPALIQHIGGSQYIKVLDVVEKQGSATQCLLFLSEQQQPDKLLNYSKHQDIEQFGVTPWTNTSFKAKIHSSAKSKTSSLLPPCDRQFKSSKIKAENRDKENKENKYIRGKVESRQKFKIDKKNSNQIKNSYSAIARYNDCPSDILNFPARQFSECKNQAQPIYIKTNSHSNQYNKIITGHPNKSKVCSRIQKDEALDIIACIVPKLQQNGHSMSVNKNVRTYMHCGTSLTGPILKQNTGLINEAVATKNNNFTNFNHMDHLKGKNFNCVSQFNITPYDLQCGIYKSNKVQTQKKQPSQINQGYQSQFQILCEQQRKAGSEYQKIKKQIMENIQKQSIIRSSMPVQSKNSKKMLGRYFKQLQSKKSKCKIKSNTANLNRTESSQYCYETSNPLTKHLYEKYRMLISRGK